MTEEIDGIEPDEPIVAPDEVQADDSQQPQAEAEGEEPEAEEQPAPKPKKTAQERISEITAARREAERERDYWRNAALNGQSAPEQRQQQEHPRDAEPNPDDFTHGDADPNYLVALAEYRAVQRISRQFEAREEQTRIQGQLSTFQQRVAEQFPDGEPEGIAALRSLPSIRQEITDVIFTSDKGPQLADHLGENPSALRRLEGLPAHLVGFELAKIEQGLSAPPPPNRVTKAPDPAPKPRGAGGQFQVAADTNDFAAFERLADKVRSS